MQPEEKNLMRSLYIIKKLLHLHAAKSFSWYKKIQTLPFQTLPAFSKIWYSLCKTLMRGRKLWIAEVIDDYKNSIGFISKNYTCKIILKAVFASDRFLCRRLLYKVFLKTDENSRYYQSNAADNHHAWKRPEICQRSKKRHSQREGSGIYSSHHSQNPSLHPAVCPRLQGCWHCRLYGCQGNTIHCHQNQIDGEGRSHPHRSGQNSKADQPRR